jgi:hypothetical protein
MFNKLWWYLMPGSIITVKWPKGRPGFIFNFHSENSDPNYFYRPELQKLVGKQGIDWDWKIDTILYPERTSERIKIKFRIGKRHLATYFALKWS